MGRLKTDYVQLSKFHRMSYNGKLAGVIVFSVLHSLAGVALLALSIWMYVDIAAYLVTPFHNVLLFVPIFILMVSGSLMTLAGLFGCCGAMQKSSCMLGTYSIFVILIFAAEIAGCVYSYSYKDQVKSDISWSVTNMVTNEYSVQDYVTLTVDAMQQKLKCCGANGISDWAKTNFNFERRENGSLSYEVPYSCCFNDDLSCEVATIIPETNVFSSSLYSEGCLSRIFEKVQEHLFTIIGVGISIAVIQIFGFAFSLVLCCFISRRNN